MPKKKSCHPPKWFRDAEYPLCDSEEKWGKVIQQRLAFKKIEDTNYRKVRLEEPSEGKIDNIFLQAIGILDAPHYELQKPNRHIFPRIDPVKTASLANVLAARYQTEKWSEDLKKTNDKFEEFYDQFRDKFEDSAERAYFSFSSAAGSSANIAVDPLPLYPTNIYSMTTGSASYNAYEYPCLVSVDLSQTNADIVKGFKQWLISARIEIGAAASSKTNYTIEDFKKWNDFKLTQIHDLLLWRNMTGDGVSQLKLGEWIWPERIYEPNFEKFVRARIKKMNEVFTLRTLMQLVKQLEGNEAEHEST